MMHESHATMWGIWLTWLLVLILLGLSVAALVKFVFILRRKDNGDGQGRD